MLETFASEYHSYIEAFLAITGMSPEMAHINIGLAIYVMGQIIFRDRRGSYRALALVAAAELFNELLDAIYFGALRLDDTLMDMVLTFGWPVLLISVSRFRRNRWARQIQRHNNRVALNPLTQMMQQAR